MRQTASGRWVPDKPPAPDPERPMPPYEVYLHHAYAHAEPVGGCWFCDPPPARAVWPPPWEVIQSCNMT